VPGALREAGQGTTPDVPLRDTIAERLSTDRARVPPVWELEFANVLRSACVRQRMTAEAAYWIAARIATPPIEVDRRSTPLRRSWACRCGSA
jgi:hypothetical protein